MPKTTEEIVAHALRRQGELENKRALWNTHWLQVAERILPRQSIFLRQGPIPEGERRTEKIFDSTASIALQRFAAALESMLTPRTQQWHDIEPQDPSLKTNRRVRLYCDDLRDALFTARYSARANFAGQVGEHYMGLGAFGTGGLFIDEDVGVSLRYRSCHLSELYIAENHVGTIDTVYRKYPMTARQAKQKFGDNLPPKILASAENKPDDEFDFLHVVQPNEELEPGRVDYRGMRFSSLYIAIEGRHLVDRGGYRSFPYAFSRHVTGPREVYGRSPAMEALPDIKMLNEMGKDTIRMAQRALSPPLLLAGDDGGLESFDVRPDSLNYGTVDPRTGRPLVMPLPSGSNFEIGVEMLDDRRKLINESFYVNLFQILVENPGTMTATEVLERAQEKGALLAPTMGRQQSEFLGPMISREADILGQAGQLPEPPPEIIDSGKGVKIEYTSPLNRYMKSGEATGFLRTIEALTPLAQIDPSIMDSFDPDESARGLAKIYGVPEQWMRSPEAIAQLKEQRATQQQAAALAQAAPLLSGSIKDVADAAATAGNIPRNQPGVGQ